jgi:hypothetical protein
MWDLSVIGGMKMRDSFFIPCLNCGSLQSRIRAAASRFGIKVKVTKTTENLIVGLRVYRTA